MIERRQLTEQDARLWAMLAHLAAFTAYFTGIGLIVGPLVVWLLKKDESSFVDQQGKESLNFHLTMLIAYFASGLLFCVGIGLFMLPVVMIVDLVFTIVAAVQAYQGVAYRYPLTLRLIS